MQLTQKETMFLKELKTMEKDCVDKYTWYSQRAHDGELKNLFSDIAKQEKTHLQTITEMLEGKVPSSQGGSESQPKVTKEKTCQCDSDEFLEDKFLCSDLLATEKYASSTYNTSVFEFINPQMRDQLNHIQTEEQQHGKLLFDYMSKNGMYATA